MSVWQALCERVHARWQANPGLSHGQVLDGCNLIERDAMHLKTLNYQVCNGGFSQWVCNGYGTYSWGTRIALHRIGTFHARAAAKLVSRVGARLNWNTTRDGFSEWRDYPSEWWLEKIDNDFFSISERLVVEAEAYFSKLLEAARSLQDMEVTP